MVANILHLNLNNLHCNEPITAALLVFAVWATGWCVELLPVLANNLGEDAGIGAEEGEALHPDEGEGVVPLELQQVGGQEPGALHSRDGALYSYSYQKKYKLKKQ